MNNLVSNDSFENKPFKDKTEAEYWLTENTSTISSVPQDFGLSKIAEYFQKQQALECYWNGSTKEDDGDIDGAIALYKIAFKQWPALDSIYEGGLPSYVRKEAVEAGLAASLGLLSVIDSSKAIESRVISCRALLSVAELAEIEDIRRSILTMETALANNPNNANHNAKTCLFLHNPPYCAMRKIAPHILAKILRFGQQAWIAADWSGVNTDFLLPYTGPLASVHGGFSSLSIRVVEHWQYEVGGGLEDPFHYDVDSVITLVVLLQDGFEGGLFRTREADGYHTVHHMAAGDAIAFVSRKHHNITPVTAGTRRSLVIEMWQGGTGHAGRL